MTNTIDLYSFADVDRSGKVRWVACELGLDINEVRLSLGDHKADEYLKLNPYSQVPAAVVDGDRWHDSNAICILLAERHPQAGLVPSEAQQRVVFWQSIAVTTTTLELPLVNYYLASSGFIDSGWKDLVGEAVTSRMRTFVDRLPENGTICSSFSLADICAGYVLRIAVQADICAYEGKLANYLDRLRARPAALESRIFDSLET